MQTPVEVQSFFSESATGDLLSEARVREPRRFGYIFHCGERGAENTRSEVQKAEEEDDAVICHCNIVKSIYAITHPSIHL